MQMNRQWMYGDRRTSDYITGLKTSSLWLMQTMVLCVVRVFTVRTRKTTQIPEPFTPTCFDPVSCPAIIVGPKHGEKGVVMEDNEEEEDDDNYHNMYPEYDDAATGVDNEDQEAADGPADDDLGRAITDAKEECETEKEKEKLEQMLKDHKTLLYPTCEDGHKKLGTTLDLLQWKAENGVTDSAFSKLLVKMKNLLPRNNELPDSTYQAKKVVCPLGLDV